MRQILIMFCIGLVISSTASAETVVRHERTAHVLTPTREAPADDIIVVYDSMAKVDSWQRKEKKEAEVLNIEKAKTRLEKIVGYEPFQENPYFKEGIELGIPYYDCIYLQGGLKGAEDYVIALHKQCESVDHPSEYLSLILMIGRGQLGQVNFVQEKLPVMKLRAGNMANWYSFQNSWVRMPEILMLRINTDLVEKVSSMDEVILIVETNSGEKHIELPTAVRKKWLRVIDYKMGGH